MNRQKPCKGINKAKEHPGCGKVTAKRTYGLCNYCLLDWAENFEEGRDWMQNRFLPKVRRQVAKNRKEEWSRQKDKMKSIARLIQEARTPFQRWIRFRDANDACISCGSTDSDLWDAGHYFKAEIYTGLIFNEMNVNKQCRKCNRFLDGNESGYYKGLVRKYGQKRVDYLMAAADKLRTYKFSREELKEIKKRYTLLLRKNESND